MEAEFALVQWVDNDHTVYFGCFSFGTPLIVPAMLISSANPALGYKARPTLPLPIWKRATTEEERGREIAWEQKADVV